IPGKTVGRTAGKASSHECNRTALSYRWIDRRNAACASSLIEVNRSHASQVGRELHHVRQNQFLHPRCRRVALGLDHDSHAVATSAFAPDTFHIVTLPTHERDVLASQRVSRREGGELAELRL